MATGGVFGVDVEGDGDEDDLCDGDACSSRSSGGSSFSGNVKRAQGLPRSASWSVSEYRLGRRGSPQLLDSTRSLIRARSARNIWAPQGGGVPPDLHLLPSQDFIENLASLREGSGDEADRGGGRRALTGGNDTSFDESEEEEEEEGDDAKGENEEGDIEVEGVPGRGKWDKELNAMMRAAWFGSKQASRRGFNSNASGSALGSGSASRDPPEEDEEEKEKRVMISGDRDGVSKGGVWGRGRGLAPASPPQQLEQPPPPVTISGDSSGGYDARGISGDRAAQEREGKRARRSGVSESRRVAGSDFLYRVMFDGLNVLVTLRVR